MSLVCKNRYRSTLCCRTHKADLLGDGKFVYIATDWTLALNDSNYWNRPS
ncbi:MAG: hypothetical protein NTZ15_17180 [Burkholderiales bacterium]|jgi:hypothetical protein|nr:hypothetical protein [Burkholderiales bacterium]